MDSPRRRSGLFGLALVIAVLGCTVEASSAQALNWVVGGSKLSSGSSQELVVRQEGVMTLTGTVLGSAVKLTLHPTSCTGTGSCTITQTGGTAQGTFTLTGPATTTDQPAACTVVMTWGTLAVTALLRSGVPHLMIAGAVTAVVLGTIVITKCSAAGKYQLKSSAGLFAEMEPLKTFQVVQPLRFSGAINAAAEGDLSIGTSPAELSGELQLELASGKAWGVQ